VSPALAAILIGIGALAFAGALVVLVYRMGRRLAADPGLAEFVGRVERARESADETRDVTGSDEGQPVEQEPDAED
jgi:hypothetical protein